MSGAAQASHAPHAGVPADPARLRCCLEREGVPRLTGRRGAIARLSRSPAPAATSYGAEILSALLADGTELRFFLKDYGSSRRPRPDGARRRARELAVYRRLLGEGELGTARYCGAVWDDGAGRHWLLLELVAGTPLRQLGLDAWAEAARWLARLQASFAVVPPRAGETSALERHDERFFAAAAERASESVSRYPAAATARLERLLEIYEASIGPLASAEPAFVHGHYTAANVLVDTSVRPVRVCPVDWELAALGSRFYDLASLCDGFRPPALHRIWDAYAGAAAEAGLGTPPREELRRIIDPLRLHRVIAWLGSAAEKGYSPAGVEKLLARGERIATLVGR